MKKISTFEKFNEGVAYKVNKKSHEKHPWDADRKESFRKKIRDHVKSLGCSTKQIGNDFEVHLKGDHIIQVMFRDSYIGIQEIGEKYTKKLNWDQLGEIKKELTSVIKSCKVTEDIDSSEEWPPMILGPSYGEEYEEEEITSEEDVEDNPLGNDDFEMNKNYQGIGLKDNRIKFPREEEAMENIKKFEDFIEERLDPGIQKKAADARKQNPGKTSAEINKQNVEKDKEKEEPKKEDKEKEEVKKFEKFIMTTKSTSNHQKGDSIKRSFSKPTEPELPFKRKLTEEEKKKIGKYFPYHSYSDIDAKGRIILGGGEESRGIYYITEKDLDSLKKVNEGLFSKEKKVSELDPTKDKDSIFKTFMSKFNIHKTNLIADIYKNISSITDGATKLLNILKQAAEDGFKGTIAATNMKKVGGKTIYTDLMYVTAAEKGKIDKFGAYQS